MPKKTTKNQAAFRLLSEEYGKATIARWAGTTRQALTKWEAIPASRVAAVAEASGLSPDVIRPEPYATP